MTKHTLNLNINPNAVQAEGQKQRILEWLLTGCSLTPMQAYKYFGCMKLATRLSELKDEGWVIQDQWITTNTGKRVKQYWL
jgi:hypothetical protein